MKTIVPVLLLVFALPSLVNAREYRIDESTRSIVFGKSCQMVIDGNSSRFIRMSAFETLLSYQSDIRRKDARVLSTVIANNAIKKCSNFASSK